MLVLTRKDSTLYFDFTYKIPFGESWVAHFSVNCGSEFDAQMRYAVLKPLLDAHIRNMREEAYKSGWKDRGSKRPKQTWFSSNF